MFVISFFHFFDLLFLVLDEFVSSLIQGQISDFEPFVCYLLGARGEQERQKHNCNYTLFNAKITMMKRPVEQEIKNRIDSYTSNVVYNNRRFGWLSTVSSVPLQIECGIQVVCCSSRMVTMVHTIININQFCSPQFGL